MPARRSARFGAARSSRRRNWIGAIKMDTLLGPVAGSANSTTDVWAPHAAELANYVAPTLVRLRGQIHLFWDFSVISDSYNGLAVAILWIGTGTTQIDWSSEEAAFSRDRVIWAGSLFLSHQLVVTAPANATGGQRAGVIEVDTKAMRKLGDEGHLMLTVINVLSSAKDLRYGYALRGLLLE